MCEVTEPKESIVPVLLTYFVDRGVNVLARLIKRTREHGFVRSFPVPVDFPKHATIRGSLQPIKRKNYSVASGECRGARPFEEAI